MTNEDFKLLEKSLKNQDFSKFFDDGDYLKFRKVFKVRGFKKGQKVLWRGQKGFFFFIIGRGKVSIRVMDERKEERVVASLGTGDFVGEISLLYNRPRVADCYAEEDDSLLFFLASRDFFDYFVAKPEVREAMEKIAGDRMQVTSKISKNADSEKALEKPEARKEESTSVIEELPEFSSLPAMDFDSLRETPGREDAIQIPLPQPISPQPKKEPVKTKTGPSVKAKEPREAVTKSAAQKKEALVLPDMESDSISETFPPDMTDDVVIELPPEPGQEPSMGKGEEDMEAPEATSIEKALKIWEGSPFLTEGQREKIKPLFSEMHLDDGSTFDIPGRDESLFIIVGKGTLLCTYNDKWCQGALELRCGQSFGELSLVFDLGSSATVRAQGNSLFYTIEKSSILSMQDKVPGLRTLFEARALRQAFSSSLRTFTASPSFEAKLKELAKKFRLEFCKG